jgi:hypothetical protein
MYQFSPQCIADFITIGGSNQCENTPSLSGLYLTDIKGVTTTLLSNLASEEQGNAEAFAAAILRRAVLYFQDKIKSAMSKLGYQISQGYKQKNVCQYSDSTVSGSSMRRGLVVRRVHQVPKYGAFFIQKLQFKAAQSGSTTVQITDSLGVVLWSKLVSFVANIVLDIPVMQEFQNDALYVTTDHVGIDTYTTNCANPSACCGEKGAKEFYAVSGWDGITSGANTFGLVLFGGFQCSFSQVICAILPNFGEAILYLCEAEILDEMVSTGRLNYSTIYVDDAQAEKQAAIQRNRAKSSIENQLGALLNSLIYNSNYCISCNKQSAPYVVSKV